jgi:hypothetical protein
MEPSLRLPAKIKHWPDGDTGQVEFRFSITVRLLKGDTFELRSKDANERALALEAKREVYRLCYEQKEDGQWAEGKDCIVEIPLTSDNLSDLFTFGRILGNISVGEIDIMTHLLGKNLAKPRGGK